MKDQSSQNSFSLHMNIKFETEIKETEIICKFDNL